MYYELYLDSLFLVNFVMNLYLLLLVNQSTYRTATRMQLVLGAFAGAFCYIMPFFCGGPAWLRYTAGVAAGMAAMYFIAFRIRNFQAFLFISRKFLAYSLLMGGGLLVLIRMIPVLRSFLTGIFGVMGAGAVIFLSLFYGQTRKEACGRNSLCKVTLIARGKAVTVTALLDSGNTLEEPISKKPVSVVDSQVLESLWEGDARAEFAGHCTELGIRAVPYRSVGKSRGILYACLLEEMRIEMEGMAKICKNAYVAASGEALSGRGGGAVEPVRMILNPAMLHKE